MAQCVHAMNLRYLFKTRQLFLFEVVLKSKKQKVLITSRCVQMWFHSVPYEFSKSTRSNVDILTYFFDASSKVCIKLPIAAGAS